MKVVDATAGELLCRLLARFYALKEEGTAPGLPDPNAVRRVLLIRPGGMGDMIVLLPTLSLLRQRFPSASIDIICETRNLGVLKLAGLEGAARPYDAQPVRLISRLMRTRYDLAIDTEQFHHFSAVFAALSRAPVRVGFKINPLRNPLYTHLVNYAPDGPEVEQFMRLLVPLGIQDGSPHLAGLLSHFRASLPASTERDLAAVAPGGAFVVLHPGTSSRFKEWRPERFSELALRLYREHSLAAVVVGDRRDVPLGDRISAACREGGCPVLSVQGKLNLEGTASVIKRARLFVGTDSGLGHLALALGRPTTILFGPSDALKWGQDDATHATVKADLPCSPCFIFGYHKPCRSVACMAQLTVESVMQACRRVLHNAAPVGV